MRAESVYIYIYICEPEQENVSWVVRPFFFGRQASRGSGSVDLVGVSTWARSRFFAARWDARRCFDVLSFDIA